MAEAAFRRVATELRGEIEAGVYPPGAALPTVDEIASRYRVARQTAHNAVKALAAEGLVNVVYRRGTYVRERPRERVVTRDRRVYCDDKGYFFDRNAQDWAPIGKPARTLGTPPPHVADLLGVPQDATVVIRDRAMGPRGASRPLQLATSYIPMDVVAEIPVLGAEHTGTGGIYFRIEDHYDAPLQWRETIAGRLPDEDEQERLGLPPNVPVLVVTRESRIVTGDQTVVVEVNETRMPAERFAVSYAIERDASAPWPREEPPQ